jgi:glycosyltransferase involved in cell wall biosynthesis
MASLEGSVDSISVVIPHHNRPTQIGAAVQSMVEQTLRPREILVMDDASNEESRRQLALLGGAVCVHYSDRNLGPAGARNEGLGRASGEWVAFLDDDDIADPRRLERQAGVAREMRCPAVGSGVLMVTPDGSRREYWGERSTGPKKLRDALIRTAAMANTLFVHRTTLLELGGFDPRFRYFEDFELGIRLAAAGKPVHFIAEPLITYQRGGHDQLTSHWQSMLRCHLAVVHKHRRSYRQVFGAVGPGQMYARICRERGLKRGGVPGRLVWGLGTVLRADVGEIPALG